MILGRSNWAWGAAAGLVASLGTWLVAARRAARAERSAERLRADLERLYAAAPHALRGPLTPIVARAQMLRTSLRDRPDDLRQVDAILRSAGRIEQLIERLAEGRLSVPERVGTDPAQPSSPRET